MRTYIDFSMTSFSQTRKLPHLQQNKQRLDDKSDMKNLDIDLQKYVLSSSSSSSSSLSNFMLSERIKEGLLYTLFEYVGQHASLDGLSINTLCEICLFLPIKDIISLHSLNKKFREIITDGKTSSDNGNGNDNNNHNATIGQAMWLRYLQRDFPSMVINDQKNL